MEASNPILHPTKNELIDIIKKMMSQEATELEMYELSEVLSNNFSHPGVIALIRNEDGEDNELTAEEIYEIAINYQSSIITSRQELIDLVEKIINCDGTEQEMCIWIDTLENSVPHPLVTDLIYHAEEDLTAEEIVEEALSYQVSLFLASPTQE